MLTKVKIEATINEEYREYIVNEDIDSLTAQLANNPVFLVCTSPYLSIPVKAITLISEIIETDEPAHDEDDEDEFAFMDDADDLL